LLLRGPDHFTPVSTYTADLLRERGVPSDRLSVVPNGTDPERFQPADASEARARLSLPNTPILLTVGRLVSRKGIDTTLRALPSVLDSISSLTYLIVGTGPDRDRLERLAYALGVQDHVHFAGRVSAEDLPSYYQASDLFVMPSRAAPPDVEGYGIVFLEAGACGVPVIGARTGGIPDAVQDGETGRLVPPSSPTALADAISTLLTTPDLAQHLGKQGLERVRATANWDHVASQLWAILTDTHAQESARGN
jgi:phosphatidylinositol alpha-1,6-mannosyltransferase